MLEHGQSPNAGLAAKISIRAVLLASSMLTSVTVATAQDQPATSRTTTIETIIVTAQKRSENIQDVPISIIALGNEKLEQLEVSAFEDYAKFLPSVTFQSTAPNATTLYFRGVVSGGDGNHSASLPSVGVYFDEQPVTTILGFLPLHIYDIDRVEAVAGPQGTLFGASAQSGVLRIITNKPDLSSFAAGYDFEVNAIEHGQVGYQFESYVNQPLSDKAAIRLVAYYKKDGGYIDNVLTSRTFPSSGVTRSTADLVENNFNDVETFGARAALKVDLNENWTVMPSAVAQKMNSHGIFAFDPELGDLNVGRFVPDFNTDKFAQTALTVEGKIGNFDLVYAGAYLRRQIDSQSDYSDYAFYYDELYGSGVYFYDDLYNVIDPTQFYQGDDSFGKYSNELRISSPQDKRLRFVAGLFQNHQSHYIHQQYFVEGLGSVISVTDHEDTIWLTEQKRTDRDLAVFGEVAFDITDQLTLTGGIRGYRFKNSLVGFFGYSAGFSSRTGEAACFEPAIVPGSPCTNLNRTVKDTGETHKINLNYNVSDGRMVYFTYSTGFRPGGVNRRGTLPPYLADKLVNYELGWKTAWLDNTVVFNAALFWQNWKDFQFPILGENGLTEIQNANQARIRGIEADGTWVAADGLTISAAISVIDAKLTENYCGFINAETRRPETNCPGAEEAPAGTRLPVVPKFKGTVTARYEFMVGDYNAHLQASASGQTTSRSSLLVFDQSILGNQGGFAVVDFTTGIAKDNWHLTAYITNAFDERADLFDFVACGITVCGAHAFQGTNRPRTFGIRFGQDF